jgi:uncharacterized protein YukE
MSQPRYTDGRGGVRDTFSNIIKKVQNFVNPTTKPAPIKLPSNASLKGASIPSPTANTKPNQGYVAPTTRSTSLSTSKPNTAFTSAMPNRSVSIAAPNVSQEATNFNGSYTPPSFTSFRDILSSFQSSNNYQPKPLQTLTPYLSPLKIGSTILSAIPRPVRQRVGQGMEDLAGTIGIPDNLDTGLSEFIAGGPTARTKGVSYASEGDFSKPRASQPLTSSNVATNSKNQSKVNMTTVKENERVRQEKQKKLDAEAAALNSKITTANNTNFIGDDPNLSPEEIYALDQGEQAFLDQGFESEEDYARKLADFKRQQQEQQFNFLKGTYERQIPFLENDVNQQVTDQTANLDRLVKEGEAQKLEDTNTYQDIVKRLTANANASKVQLGNIFSGLGTVDSSAFQNQLGKLDQTLIEGTGSTERDMAKRLSTISDTVNNAKRETESLIASIKNEGAAKKQAILEKINLSAEQRNQALDQVNMELDQAITQAKQFYEQKKFDLLNQAKEFAMNRQLIFDQGAQDVALQNNLYQNEAKLNNIVGSNIDPTAEYVLKDYVKRRGKVSSTELAQLAQSLGIDLNTAYNYISGISV